MFKIKIANLPIGIDNRYRDVEVISRAFLTDEDPLFTVSVSTEEIEDERSLTDTDFRDSYYESVITYRKIAEHLPEYDACLFHGSAITLGGKAYIITANSGVGKTTHTRLWLSEFPGEVEILNGDKPTLRMIDGVPYASGTPWNGKENYGKNGLYPIAGFAFLTRAEKNSAREISISDAVFRFMSQIYLPKKSGAMLAKTMSIADKLLKNTRLVLLECNMEPEAAHVARAALTGNDG